MLSKEVLHDLLKIQNQYRVSKGNVCFQGHHLRFTGPIAYLGFQMHELQGTVIPVRLGCSDLDNPKPK